MALEESDIGKSRASYRVMEFPLTEDFASPDEPFDISEIFPNLPGFDYNA